MVVSLLGMFDSLPIELSKFLSSVIESATNIQIEGINEAPVVLGVSLTRMPKRVCKNLVARKFVLTIVKGPSSS